jgi:hypothetical protein
MAADSIQWLKIWLGVLTFVSVGLIWDSITQRKARKVAEEALAALRLQLKGDEDNIRMALSRGTTALALAKGCQIGLGGVHLRLGKHGRELTGISARVDTLGLSLARKEDAPLWARILAREVPPTIEGDREALHDVPPASGFHESSIPVETDLAEEQPPAAVERPTVQDLLPPEPSAAAPEAPPPATVAPEARVAEAHYRLVHDAAGAAAHCLDPSCDGLGKMSCACPCPRCTQRRAFLTQAQRACGVHVLRTWGESREAWAQRALEIPLDVVLAIDRSAEPPPPVPPPVMPSRKATLLGIRPPEPSKPPTVPMSATPQGTPTAPMPSAKVEEEPETRASTPKQARDRHKTLPSIGQVPKASTHAPASRAGLPSANVDEDSVDKEPTAILEGSKYRLTHAHGRTQVLPQKPAPSKPAPSRKLEEKLDPRVDRLWKQRVAAAQLAGEDVQHCNTPKCFDTGGDIAACYCGCPGCTRVRKLLSDAVQEVLGTKH